MATNSDDEETLVTIGTPLEVPDEDELVKKPIKIQDIQAKDDKGRARFHGAFTGGFSAGYFNSVGSKQGWTPSEFISSRVERNKEQFGQKPEDFMDDEDMGEYGIAPRKFVTGSKFSSEERKKRQFDDAQRATADTVLPGAPALLEIIVPERLTVGVRLLRKMGWKEGQGIGPRLSKKQKTKTLTKMYGCLPPPDPDDVFDYDSIFSDVTFAPQDSSNINMSVKVNTHGLGYRGLDPNKALPSAHRGLFEAPRVTKGGSRRGIRGQGFGVGALEDEDDDIYSTDNMSNYDMTMGVEEDDKFGWTGPSGKRASVTPVTYVGRMLDGFTLSSKKLVQKKDFPPPKLPRDFRPFHRFRQDADTSSLSTQSNQGVDYRLLLEKPVDSDRTGSELSATSSKGTVYKDAAARSLALEEKAFVGSVFDLISKEGKEKLDKIKQGTNLTDISASAGSSTEVNSSSTAQSSHLIEEKEKKTSDVPREASGHFSQGMVGFKPFQTDPGKQVRYEKYLELVNSGNKDSFSAIFTSSQTEWEIEKEKEEFTRAAKLYRPLSSMMAMRFTRAGHDEEGNKSKSQVDEKMDVNEEVKAAQMKMFGKLTREVLEWHPDNVVCKRFNVPNPYPGSSFTGLAGGVKRDKYSVFNFLNFADPTRSDAYHATESQGSKADAKSQSDASANVNSTASKSSSLESAKSENTADDVLSRGKSMKSIFSHLVNAESETQRTTKPVSFSLKSTKSNKPKEFKSIFSHLEKSENSVKGADDKTVTKETDNAVDIGTDVPMECGEDGANKKTEESGMDLFRAIFKNSDSEDSSSSCEESAKESSVQEGSDIVDKNPVVIKTYPQIINSQPRDQDNALVNVPVVNKLPGNNEHIETLTSRLSPTVESDDSYGPALPPTLSTDTLSVSASSSVPTGQEFIDLTQNSSYKHKHKEKHKSKKDKKDKHKKSKHKKKNKSKEKKRKKHSNRGNDSDTTDKDTEDDDDDVDNAILSRLKSIKSSQRKKVMDF